MKHENVLRFSEDPPRSICHDCRFRGHTICRTVKKIDEMKGIPVEMVLPEEQMRFCKSYERAKELD